MEYSPWFVVLLGMGTVFAGLFVLILLTSLMSFFYRKFSKQEKSSDAAGNGNEISNVSEEGEDLGYEPHFADRRCFDAIVASAIATYMGTDISGLRINSIKCISGGDGERQEFVAAVSASIASVIGTDVSGLRIHSIKRI